MSSSTYNQSLWRRRENGLKRLGCWCAGAREGEQAGQLVQGGKGQAILGEGGGTGQDTLWKGQGTGPGHTVGRLKG